MLAVRDRYQPGRDADSVADALSRFESRVARTSAPRMLLSQESLSAARPAQVQRFLAACARVDVHVVITVRDLAGRCPRRGSRTSRPGAPSPTAATCAGCRRWSATARPGIPGSSSTPRRWWRDGPPSSRRAGSTSSPCRRPGDPDPAARALLPGDRGGPGRVGPRGDPEQHQPGASAGGGAAPRQPASCPTRCCGVRCTAGSARGSSRVEVLGDQTSRSIRVPARLRPWCEEVSGRQVAALQAGRLPRGGNTGGSALRRRRLHRRGGEAARARGLSRRGRGPGADAGDARVREALLRAPAGAGPGPGRSAAIDRPASAEPTGRGRPMRRRPVSRPRRLAEEGRWRRSWPCPRAAVSTSTSACRRPGRRTCRARCCATARSWPIRGSTWCRPPSGRPSS